MHLRLFVIFLILCTGISGVFGDVVVSDSVSTAAGSMSYSITKSDGIGLITQMPTVDLVSSNEYISVAVKGCSIQGALSINGKLNAISAHGDIAEAIADIKGPGASVANYNLYGYVTPDLAWAGQYVGSARGTSIKLKADGDVPPHKAWNPFAGGWTVTPSAWAGSVLLTNDAGSPVFIIDNWYQDSMASHIGGSPWAMSDIYSGTGAVQSSEANDWIDVYTGREFGTDSGANAWVPQENFIHINSQSMAYVDPKMSYCSLDYAQAGVPGVYSYWYINQNTGVNDRDTIFY
jgi:hypothetical protein